jgi:PTS system ascorbate-specific IIA component
MTVGVLIVTHGNIGESLLDTAIKTLGFCPLQTETLSAPPTVDVDEIDAMAQAMCIRLDEGQGVLVLTDIYGSTPSNIANKLLKRKGVSVISGINLPMLIRVMNYPKLPLAELINKALTGGHDGILLCGEDTK